MPRPAVPIRPPGGGGQLAASRITIGPQSPKLIAGTGKDETHLIVLATGDRGLAGAFNTNIVRAARKKAEELEAQGKKCCSTSSAARAGR